MASPDGIPDGRVRRRLATAVTSVLVLAAIVAVVLDPHGRGPAQPPLATSCHQVTLLTGQPGTPYYGYGDVLKSQLERAGHGWTVNLSRVSKGSVDNLVKLRAAPKCTLALVQMNVAVDAFMGLDAFAAEPMRNLRSVAPVYYDLLHVLVLADSPIKDIGDLCGQPVGVGLSNSGTEQFARVLRRSAELAGCPPPDRVQARTDIGIDEAMVRLRRGDIKAVVWAGGAPTEQIVQSIQNGTDVRLLPAGGLRRNFQDDWDRVYRTRRPYYRGPVFGPAEILPVDYPGIAPTPTLSVANAFVTTSDQDAELVRVATRVLFSGRSMLARRLWPGTTAAGRTFPDENLVYRDPTFCYVRPHDEAAAYYERKLHRAMDCRSP